MLYILQFTVVYFIKGCNVNIPFLYTKSAFYLIKCILITTITITGGTIPHDESINHSQYGQLIGELTN